MVPARPRLGLCSAQADEVEAGICVWRGPGGRLPELCPGRVGEVEGGPVGTETDTGSRECPRNTTQLQGVREVAPSLETCYYQALFQLIYPVDLLKNS